MTARVIGSREARIKWRDLLDDVNAGRDAVIERSGRPVAALIPYADYQAIAGDLEDRRADRRAIETYEAWKRDRSTARPFEDFEAELMAEGLFDGEALSDPDHTRTREGDAEIAQRPAAAHHGSAPGAR